MKKAFLALAAVLGLSACVPTIDYSEVHPNFAGFSPSSVAILPFTNQMGMENANERMNSALTNSILKRQLFANVMDPSRVKGIMASNELLLDMIVKYRTRWIATGMPDKAASQAISKALGVDSFIFGEITQWAKAKEGSDEIGRAGITFRWVDGKTGEMLWKGSHSGESRGSMLMAAISKTDHIIEAGTSVMHRITAAWPKKAQ